ncbi:MAG TPA: glycosyltransferase [Thermodesulfovibrionia bacterium]|nr:glycosyltransferase [Thermodesulfovibrionia bacterium]
MKDNITQKEKTRIGYVIDSLYLGGAQRVLVDVVAGLSKLGYDQKVYSLNDVIHPTIFQQFMYSQTPVVVIGKSQLLSAFGLLRLFQEFRKWRPHVVQTLLPYGDIIGRTVAHFAKVPVIVSATHSRNLDKPQWKLFLDRMTIRWVNRVVLVSEQLRSTVTSREGVREEQIVVIPNGINREFITKPVENCKAARERIRAEFGVSLDTNVIVTVGRLSPEKGHLDLFQAFVQVLAKLPDTALMVVGDGPLYCQLNARVLRMGLSKKVFFLSQRTDVGSVLCASDVFAQSSLFEGMPIAVMEAMAASKPVVATEVDGTRELVQHNVTGWLVPPGRPDQLADYLIRALDNPDESYRVGKAASELIAKHYTVSKMVTSYHDLYHDLMQHDLH